MLDLIVDKFAAEPVVVFKNALRLLHFAGLGLGLGVATALDFYIVRHMFASAITEEQVRKVEFMAKVVNFGLMLLWATGIGFLFYYSQFDQAKLANQKLIAKAMIVGILTLNGAFIHGAVIPHLRRSVGRTLLDGLGGVKRALFVTSGAVSATSWYVPAALGAFTQFNGLPATTIMLAYAMVLGLATTGAHGLAQVAVWLTKPASLIDSFKKEPNQ